MSLTGDRTPRTFIVGGADGQFSPDGKWMAYQSAESGNLEVYIVAVPRTGSAHSGVGRRRRQSDLVASMGASCSTPEATG